MICDRLKILLKTLNISQRQFAIKINLDAGYFFFIMQGKVIPPDRILLLIENVFNVNKNWLENGEGEMFSTQGLSLAKKQVLESIEALTDEQVNAVSSFIKYLTDNKETEKPTPQMTVEEAEAEYIKSRSKFAQNTASNALNTFNDTLEDKKKTQKAG